MFALFKGAATKNSSWHYKYELYALGVLAVAIFISAALLSHSHADLSWFYYDTVQHAPKNWCGYTGACISALFFYLFGSASVIIIAALCFIIYALCAKIELRREWDRLTAYMVLMLVSSTLLALHAVDFFSSTIPGGYCGRLCARVCHYWVDSFGTFILLYTLLAACLIIVSRFSFLRVFQYLFSGFVWRGLYQYGISPIGTMLLMGMAPFKKLYQGTLACISKKFFTAVHEKNDIFDDRFWVNLETKTVARPAPQPETAAPLQSEPHEPQAEQHVDPTPSDQPLRQMPAYQLPRMDMFIGVDEEQNDNAVVQELEKRAKVLEEKLEHFDVFGKVTAIKRGPVVTMFEYQPQIDTKISKIIALEDDLSLALQALSIRIIAPIPGKSVVGFEVANKHRRGVLLSQLIKSDAYQNSTALLPMILGVDTVGATIVIDLSKMPHLLIAGSTGSGKSVALNAMLMSLLCKKSPDDVRLILIDPKRLEFAPLADIAHLLFPIITDPKLAPSALRWVVKQMEQRYENMAQAGVRNIYDYRAHAQKNNLENMPFIVVVIDELADLMMTSGKEVEDAIIRISQMARAAGIHIIAATQRPSVDVITGLIKVNFPSRISFRVTSKIDSRTILDASGADKLLGRGDMLFLDANDAVLKRAHGAYVLDKEVQQVIAHIRSQRPTDYLDLKQVISEDKTMMDSEIDSMFDQVCQFLNETDEVSISLLQRRFRIGYNRSARIIDMLESQGLIAPSYGGKTRKVVR